MTDLERLMRGWLVSGTDAQKRHAALRLALPFDGQPAAGPPPPPLAPPVATPAVPGHPGPCCGGTPEFFDPPGDKGG